uniref:Uncharacterized protein n=1 Tax=Chromera velia CCMP2878 TaxID=1169474 RepID=A0A0G4FC83_9ALVE|mmetsp:Transcript_4369/g.8818  ORF Transcript_4369/g.8818 Transcript_4369/m.8818 type:complete len:141 (-) Transcript_4369:432-854(-)|eukprot:Cvel_3067.t1-p1 / transcript=Cvel_3067.t1 / gene=Cvel_3067 / organism=Chromera_velia_CCMP2878 / gene_product=hypothetical protein / transcript_product=hypothetical protein / location=Cvel_scaffold122:110917-111336(+) / protein_length=140 / sequence_SO=supercontig / SO=protein_coding / is_pseudo=false
MPVPLITYTKVMAEDQKIQTSRTSRGVQECELCVLEKRTTWYVDCEDFVILECDQCQNPIAVLRAHGPSVSRETEEAMEQALREVADRVVGTGEYYIDKKQRSIFDHIHWHARDHTPISRLLESNKFPHLLGEIRERSRI